VQLPIVEGHNRRLLYQDRSACPYSLIPSTQSIIRPASSRYSDAQEIEIAFQAIYEQSISEMESEWWAFLRAWRPPERPSWGKKISLLLFSGSALVLVLLGGIALSSLVDRVFESLAGVIAGLRRR
jgi:hypothetical protein